MIEEDKLNDNPQSADDNLESGVQAPQPGSNNDLFPESKVIDPDPAVNVSEPAVAEPQQFTKPTNESTGQADYKPESKNMEVHHHGHVHEKKKWKEYLFQFLMLFLAVFCGFLAEYQLEHTIEHNREKQFIKSLMNDVQADINRISVIISQRTTRERRLDSLTLLMNTKVLNVPTAIIYFYAVTPARSLFFRFIPNDGTMQQLKNSGAFRLIRNRAVADSIARYDVSIRNYLRQGEIEEALIQDYRTASAYIFDALVFDRMLDADNNVRFPADNPALLSYEKRDLQSWNYKMYSMKALNKASRRDARLLLRQAENLLKTLKTEYHIKQ